MIYCLVKRPKIWKVREWRIDILSWFKTYPTLISKSNIYLHISLVVKISEVANY